MSTQRIDVVESSFSDDQKLAFDQIEEVAFSAPGTAGCRCAARNRQQRWIRVIAELQESSDRRLCSAATPPIDGKR